MFDQQELDREQPGHRPGDRRRARRIPDDHVFDLFQEAAYPDQPIGRTILGTVDSVKSFDPGVIGKRSYMDRQLRRRPDGRLTTAGNVDHGELVRHAEAQFGGLNGGVGGQFEPARYVGGTRTSAKPFEQSHLIMAFTGPSYRAPEFYVAQVFSGLFGGGMSSRLFQEVRERRRLCYAIYSSCWALADTGLFGIHAATGPEAMEKLIDVVGVELVRAAADKPAEAELARSKAQIKAGLLMGLESSSARAEQMARQLLLFDRLIEPPELIERIDSVTAERVRELAAKLVSTSQPSVAVVGAGRKGQGFARMAAERAAKV